LDQPTILMVSEEAAFAHELKKRWQQEQQVPAFTLMGSDLCRQLDVDAFTVAIVGPMRSHELSPVLNALHATGKPVLMVCTTATQADALRRAHPEATVVTQQEGWPDVVVALASEMIRCQEAVLELEQLEVANALLERQAALGSYILEMRHTLNNALTSILGNAELLLLEAEPVKPGARAQIETIRSMAVRIHETLARFSSIDKELSAQEQLLATARSKSRAVAAGTIH
jgi:signal transduction histidine kinase